MNIIFVLIPIAMLFVAIAVVVFFWAVKNDQYDDLDRHSVSILFDDKPLNSSSKADSKQIHQSNNKD